MCAVPAESGAGGVEMEADCEHGAGAAVGSNSGSQTFSSADDARVVSRAS